MSERPLVAVTGGAGVLGAATIRALRAEGRRVRALVHRRPVPEADETIAGDVLDEAAIAALCDGADAVVHAAAVTHARSARAYDRVNAGGTRLVLSAAEVAGVARVVLVGTSALAADGGGYSRSKLEAERLAAAAAVPVTVVRLPELYGGGHGSRGIDDLVARARAGRPLLVVGSGQQEIRPVHVDDAARAVAAAVAVPDAAGKTYTLAGERTTLRAVAEQVVAQLGSSSRIVEVPEAAVAVAARLARVLPLPLYPDQLARLRAARPEPSPEAADELGFRPRTLAEGLANARSARSRGAVKGS